MINVIVVMCAFVGVLSYITNGKTVLRATSNSDVELSSSSSSMPHIILYTVDDMGWNDIGFHSTDISGATPYMDSLLKKSVLLTNYYSQPSCTPSRSTIMSGKFVHKTGYQNMEVQHNYPVGMAKSMKLMPAHLRELGYRTHMVGKWNIGHCHTDYLPHTRGFNSFLGYLCPGHGYRDYNCGMNAGVKDMLFAEMTESDDGTKEYHWKTGAEYRGTYDTEVYRDEVASRIATHASEYSDKPFFLWYAQHGVHGFEDSDPNPPKSLLTTENIEYIETLRETTYSSNSSLKSRLVTASLMMSIDNALKHMIDHLDANDMMDNTFIFVHSDNGGDPDYKFGHPGNNWPLRGEKFYYLEGGIRVPAFIYAPGLIPESLWHTKFDGLLHHVDLLTTFVALAGTNAKEEDEHLDGINFMPAILASDTSMARNEIVFSLPRNTHMWNASTSDDVAVLRVGRYKIILNGVEDKRFTTAVYDTNSFLLQRCSYSWFAISNVGDCNVTNQLFDIAADPLEVNNLYYDDDYSDLVDQLIDRMHTVLYSNPYSYGMTMYEYYLNYTNATEYDSALETYEW